MSNFEIFWKRASFEEGVDCWCYVDEVTDEAFVDVSNTEKTPDFLVSVRMDNTLEAE